MKTTYPLLANRLVYIIKGGGGSSSYLVRASETDMLPGFLSQKIDSTLQIRDNKMGVSGNVFDNFNSAVARIELTQQGLKSQFSDFSDQYQTFSSSFEQTAKGFAMAVYSQEIDKFSGEISEKYSTREQTADYIKDLVSNTTLDQYKNVVSQSYSTREQTATLISDQVYAAVFHPDTGVRSEMMSAINQTAAGIEMMVQEKLYGDAGIAQDFLSKINQESTLLTTAYLDAIAQNSDSLIVTFDSNITQTSSRILSEVEGQITAVKDGVERNIVTYKTSIDQQVNSITATVQSNYSELTGIIDPALIDIYNLEQSSINFETRVAVLESGIDLSIFTNGQLNAGILIERVNLYEGRVKIAADKIQIDGTTTFAAGYNPYAIQAELALYKTDNDAAFTALDEDQQALYQDLQAQGDQIVTLDGKYTAVATEQGTLSSQYGVLNGQVVEIQDLVSGHNAAILTINGQMTTIDTSIGTINQEILSINSSIGTLNTDFNILSDGVVEDINTLNDNLLGKINEMANRKNTRYISASSPVPPEGGFRIGDEWVKEIEIIEEGETIYEYEPYMWFGTEWRPNLTTVDGARITTGVIDAQRIIATELFSQEIGAVNLHVAQGFVGGFKINNMLVAESEDGKGISIDPTKREILIKDLQEGLGISQISIRAGDLTPEAELNASGGIGFKSSVTSNELNIRNSNGSEITSNDIRATGGVTVRQYVCSGGLNKAKLKSTVPAVNTERFVIEVGKNYVADLPYNFRIYHNLGTRNKRSHKLHGDLKVTITSRLVGRTAAGVTKELVAAAPVITNIRRSTRETTMFERPVTRKISFYSIDCTTAYWEIDVKLEGNLTYQQWTTALDGRYWMTSKGWGIDYRGVIPDGCTISPSMGIMEMTTSGFQFMWGSGRFFKIDGQDPAHFITSQGKWVHDGNFQLNGSDIVTIDNVSSAIASDLSAYATKNYVDTGFYTKLQSDGRFAKKAGDGAQDFNVKDLIIHGQVNQWLAQQLVVDDARIQVNRKQGGAVADSGLVIYDKDTSSKVSSLVYDVNGVWRAGGDAIATKPWVENSATAYNAARLGGYSAIRYPRKSESAVITGAWSFNNNVALIGDRNTLALYYNIDGVAKRRVNEIILGREANFHKWRILNQSTLSWGNNPDLSFQFLGATGSTYTDVLTMTYDRNVGIGTDSPTERLHVAGNGLFTGNITAKKGILSLLDVSGISTLQGEAILGDKLRVAKESFFSEKIQAANAVSQLTGWQISKDGAADFRHIYTDELQAKAFTADISQALVGSDILTKSVAKLAQDFVVAASGQTSLFVEELEGFPEMQVFAVNDMLRLRVFDRGGGGLLIKDVWVKVNSYVGTAKNVQEFKVTTVVNGGVVGKPIYKGSMVLDYGTSGSGVIERTVLDAQGSPYSRVITWGRNTDGTVDVNANPWDNTKKFLHYQSGNLEGIANCSGWGVYSQNSFLTGKIVVGDLTKLNNYMEYNPVDGLTIKGKITVTGGNAATKQDIDDLVIGGRNIALGTNKGGLNWVWSTSKEGAQKESIVEGSIETVKFTQDKTDFTWSYLFFNKINFNQLKTNTDYVLSVMVKASVITTFRMRLQRNNSSNPLTNWSAFSQPTIVNEWVKLVFKVKTLSSLPALSDQGIFLSGFDSTLGVTYQLKDLKLEEGTKATSWTPAPEDVQTEINEAKTNAQNAQTDANTANSAVGSLNTYVDGAFKDGVIDSAEAVAIEKYINSINETMAKSEESYSVVYLNTYLEGTPKTDLLNAKVNLWGQRDTLINKINEVIADGKVTSSEKSQVDSAFSTFNGLMKSFTEMLEKANKAIQVKLDNLSKGYVNDLEIGAVNYILNSELKGSSTGWIKPSILSVTDTNEGVKVARTDNVSDNRGMFAQYIPNTFSLNDEVVLSAYLRLDSGTLSSNTSFVARFFDSSGASVQDISISLFDKGVDGTYKRYHRVGKITNENIDFTKDVQIILAIPKGVSTIQMRNVQLEKGNKLTDWKLAPEDVQAYTDALTTRVEDRLGLAQLENINQTLITGNKVRTSLLEVTNIVAQGITAGHVEGLTLNFDKGKIGGWSMGAVSIASENEFVRLHKTRGIVVSNAATTNNVFANNNRVNMYYLSPTNWGLIGQKNGVSVFQLGSTNQIAGINFDNSKLSTENWELNKDGSAKFAGGLIKMLADGDTTIGDVHVDVGGALVVKEGTENRVLITKDDITTLAAIASSTQDKTVNNSAYTTPLANAGHYSISQPKAITVNNNGTRLTVTGSFGLNLATNAGQRDSQATLSAWVYLRKVGDDRGTGVLLASGSVTVNKLTGEAMTDSFSSRSLNKEAVVAAGQYCIEADYSYYINSSGLDPNESSYYNAFLTINASSMHALYDGAYQRNEIGKNGIGVIIDANNYSFFGKEGSSYRAVEKVSRATMYDKPGVLFAGKIASGGGLTDGYWGAKYRSGSYREGNNIYRIHHNVGHKNYYVHLTPHSDARMWVLSKETTYVRVQASLATLSFDFAITGNNQ